jgi:hypothetical protein
MKKVCNGNNKGGSVQLKPSIINNVHDLVNQHRKEIGLKTFEFPKEINRTIDPLKLQEIIGEEMNDNDKVIKVERPVDWPAPPAAIYHQYEIDEAIRYNNGGSIRVKINAGMVKILCACNCGGHIPVSLAMQGWRFIRGHKNQSKFTGLSKTGQLKNGSSHSKPVFASEVYENYASRIAMDIANVESEMSEITKQAELLTIKLRTLKEKHSQLKQAESALKPLFEKKPLTQGVGA